jgi:hypothetical protein
MDICNEQRLQEVAEGKYHLSEEEVKEIASLLHELKQSHRKFTCGSITLNQFLRTVMATLSGNR